MSPTMLSHSTLHPIESRQVQGGAAPSAFAALGAGTPEEANDQRLGLELNTVQVLWTEETLSVDLIDVLGP